MALCSPFFHFKTTRSQSNQGLPEKNENWLNQSATNLYIPLLCKQSRGNVTKGTPVKEKATESNDTT